MKKSRVAALLLTLVFSLGLCIPAAAAPLQARPTSQNLYLMEADGSTTHRVIKELPIYNINYNNYMKLRDIGYLLDFQVEFDPSLQGVSILTDCHSDGVQVSTGAAQAPASAKPAWSTLYVNGVSVPGLTMYNIQGNNYVKLRDLAKAVGFGCVYSGSLKAVVLSPFFQYTPNDQMTQGKALHRTYQDGLDNQTFSRTDLFPQEPAKPDPKPVIPDPEPSKPSVDESAFLDEVVDLVNQERAKEGIAPLQTMDALQHGAAIRAKELPETFSHTRPDGSSCFSVFDEISLRNYRLVGENIAAGQPTPQAVVTSWMNSPGHRRNMMNPEFTSIGVGHVHVGTGYQHYWVQLFWC